jgi:hypothetical protein
MTAEGMWLRAQPISSFIKGVPMSRGPSTFRQQDVTRALKATVAAGIEVQRVEIDKAGKITLITAKPADSVSESSEVNEWDNI